MRLLKPLKNNKGGGVDTIIATTTSMLLITFILVYFFSQIVYFVSEGHINLTVQQCVATASKNGKLDSTVDMYLKSKLRNFVTGGLSNGFTIQYYTYTMDATAISPDQTTSVNSSAVTPIYTTAKSMPQGTIVGISVEESDQSMFGHVVHFVTGSSTIIHMKSYKELMVEKW